MRVLYVVDRQSGKYFLIDTGAGLSVLPPEDIDRPHKGKGKSLTAANGSEIITYGERATELDFGLGRVYNWVFHVADVATPILGIDFLPAATIYSCSMSSLLSYQKSLFIHQDITLYIITARQEGPSTAGLDASALISSPQ